MLAKSISVVEREERKRQTNGGKNGNVFLKEPSMIERVLKSL